MTAASISLHGSTVAKRKSRRMASWPFFLPVIVVLLLWTVIPLLMTLGFSFERYNLLNPATGGFAGVENYNFIFGDPSLWISIWNTFALVAAVLVITIVAGIGLALIFDQEFFGRTIARLLVIAPFFVMPTVGALLWKNLLMHPVNGLFASFFLALGMRPLDWFTTVPMTSIVIILAWRWIPFATLTLLTALQSLDREQLEAARMDGAKSLSLFRFIIFPHMKRSISIVVLLETMFLLTTFIEIYLTTSGGPGLATTTLTYLIYIRALLDFDVGGASAGGVVAVIVANVVGYYLIRSIAKSVVSQP